jgi:serine/threonine-protein kinase
VSAELGEGQTFGAYHIAEVVGSGGMGIVYRAEQRILGRTVALKVIRPEIADSGDYRSRFLREVQLAAAVDHPNVVSVFDAGEQDGQLYLSMQWIDGQELGTLIHRQQQLAPQRTVLIGIQLAEALQAVHDGGLVHRDIKPSNVLVRDISGRDHAYLTDFGIAKAPDAHDGLTRTGWTIGTPGYLSPEQIRGEQPGPPSDLYALGCVIFEALTGQPPFRGDNDLAVRWAHASSPRPVASAVCPALGTRYDAFLDQALAIEPQHRFSSGQAFADALQSAHTAQAANPTPTPATRDTPTQQMHVSAPLPPPISATGPVTAAPSPDAPSPTLLRPSEPRPDMSVPPSADATTQATTPHRGTHAPQPHSTGRASGAPGAGRLIVLLGGLVFIASVTLLPDYTYNKSLWKATHGLRASPLTPDDFRNLVVLVGLALIFTAISAAMHSRLVMIGALITSLGLIGYILNITTKGAHHGFKYYGSTYWLSLAAAVLMLIGAGVTLAARPTATDPYSSPRDT